MTDHEKKRERMMEIQQQSVADYYQHYTEDAQTEKSAMKHYVLYYHLYKTKKTESKKKITVH